MTPPLQAAAPALARQRRRVLADLVSLTKPRVVLMVLVTTAVGYHVGLPGPPDYLRLVHLLAGTALAAGGTLALNMYWERDVDALMIRTRLRPLPDGRLAATHALFFAAGITLAGLVYLGVAVGPGPAAVTAATFVLYLFAYTPLKMRTPLCTFVGAVPGALPPVTGWVAARGDLGAGAWILFGLLFLWQLPHTLAIGRLYRDDYARAGVRLLPVIDVEGTRTARYIAAACAGLLVMSLAPAVAGMAGGLYLAGALACGLAFTTLGVREAAAPSPAGCRRLMYASLLYLPLVLALLAFDRG